MSNTSVKYNVSCVYKSTIEPGNSHYPPTASFDKHCPLVEPIAPQPQYSNQPITTSPSSSYLSLISLPFEFALPPPSYFPLSSSPSSSLCPYAPPTPPLCLLPRPPSQPPITPRFPPPTYPKPIHKTVLYRFTPSPAQLYLRSSP